MVGTSLTGYRCVSTVQQGVTEMSTATLTAPGAADPAPDSEAAPRQEAWYSSMAGVIVAGIGLLVLFGIVAIAILTLPNGDTQAQNIIAIASSAFGVIGTIVGAYFGVRAANRAVDKAHEKS
jgi:hypothetical protein